MICPLLFSLKNNTCIQETSISSEVYTFLCIFYTLYLAMIFIEEALFLFLIELQMFTILNIDAIANSTLLFITYQTIWTILSKSRYHSV